MPASKKPATKSTTKKPAAKKAPAKRATTVKPKKASASKASSSQYKSFQASPDKQFFSVRITDQTIYWAVLGIIVLALGLWVISINDRVQHLYDQIDTQNAESALLDEAYAKKSTQQ